MALEWVASSMPRVIAPAWIPSPSAWWVWLVAGLAALPLGMTLANLRHFRKAPLPVGPPPASPPTPFSRAASERPAVSVLIPARNEARGIEPCVRSVLANRGVDLEVIVLDDHSDDGTARVVRAVAGGDPRVSLHAAPPLPSGWNGKQHACLALSRLASHDRLMWIDADVRLGPDALSRALAFQDRSGAPLVSGFPQQVAITWLEKLVVPLIQVVLLGYLPMGQMRRRRSPGLGAGCGQMFLARRMEYEALGGHGAVRRSMHDGVTLPRAMRRAGYATDLFDASDVASCRMYDAARTVWRGFAKNATEGMASPAGIGVWTALLVGGWVVAWVALAGRLGGLWTLPPGATAALALAAASNLVTALMVAFKCRQTRLGAILAPAGMAVLVAIQWYALSRKLLGVPSTWRDRAYAAGQSTEA